MTRTNSTLVNACLAYGCESPVRSNGYCSRHYTNNRAIGHPLSKGDLAMAFLSGIVAIETDKCVIWPFWMKPPYGGVTYSGKRMTAHRAALIMLTGYEPHDMVAAHGPCHNPACVNPHPCHGMRWATLSGNARDKIRDGTSGVGEESIHAKVTDKQAIEIYNQRLLGKKYKEIATAFSVGRWVVENICTGRRYRHLGLKPIVAR